jgi:transketolase
VAQELEKKGYSFKVASLHTIKPINKDDILKHAKDLKKIFTFEEHSIIGGVGSAVAEVLAESDWQGKFRIIGIPDEFSKEIGDADYLRSKYFINKEGILKRILKEI